MGREAAAEAQGQAGRQADAQAGVEIAADAGVEAALAAAQGAETLVVRFASFKDGRGFSLAAVLREHGFEGRLVAAGNLLPDQAAMLRRAGFDAVAPDTAAEAAPDTTLDRTAGSDLARPSRAARPGFSHAYQPAADGAEPAYRARALAARRAEAEALDARYAEASPEAILEAALEAYAGRIAMLSSFGAEAAVGLELLSRVAPETPVLFLDTKRHFAQTLSYRDALARRLGLADLRVIEPEPEAERAEDPTGDLYARDSAACCDLRKVRPLAKGLAGFDAIITGRKRYHGGERADLGPFEFDGERVKVNPLVALSPQETARRFRALDLPAHPLVAQGYPSIGCWPCTAPAEGGIGARDGRWAEESRSECGIFDPAAAERARKARRSA